MNFIENKTVNTLRVLSADQVEKANSGHPGMPLGASPMMYTLWRYHYKAYGKAPRWYDRDRFVLSVGHGSALYYSALHLFGYDITVDDLKSFRQYGSKTAGHPEYEFDNGIDLSTGPLGQGIAGAVGMAIAEQRLAAEFNTEKTKIIDHYTYVILGDGCLMEGISTEAAHIAGNLGLGKLIVLFDSNNITIDGTVDIASKVDVRKAYEAFGWHTLFVEDGNDIEEINKAIKLAKAEISKPTLIEIKTTIGYGAPNKAGKSAVHGSPLGKEELILLKKGFGFDPEKSFQVDQDVREFMAEIVEEKKQVYENWLEIYSKYQKENPNLFNKMEAWFGNSKKSEQKLITDEFLSLVEKLSGGTLKEEATRISGERALNIAKETIAPNLIGGSADLAASTKAKLKDSEVFDDLNRKGDTINFGIREFAMSAICNGITAHNGLKAFCSTFFVFSDYMKAGMRLSSLMGLPVVYILSHDSVAVGEDGPTHQPIEQLAMLRSMPNLNVYRPADAVQTAASYIMAFTEKRTPSAIVLSRQNLPQLTKVSETLLKGACNIGEVYDDPEGIIIATGSEVSISFEAQKALLEKGKKVNVVSVFCNEIFLKHKNSGDKECKEMLREDIKNRIIVEAGHPMGMMELKTDNTVMIGVKDFGFSAPGNICMEKNGLTSKDIVEKYIMNFSK